MNSTRTGHRASDCQPRSIIVGVWSELPVSRRADILRNAADLYEKHIAELTTLATREAGKTVLDGIAEVREAVDFLRYYANEAERLEAYSPG